jgi:hypothetical protein
MTTREDIIELANKAADQAPREDWNTNAWVFGEEMLEYFAELVAAAERNKVAQWMIDRSYATGHGDTVEDLLKELVQSVREEERELCAQICERMAKRSNDIRTASLEMAAENIRARGEK